MIIQCDKCQSKFKLDDSKVTPEGAKVKCKKCANIFTVFPENTEIKDELKFEDFELGKEDKKEEIKEAVQPPAFDFKLEEKKEEEAPASPAGTDEFSWDQFNFEPEGKEQAAAVPEESQAPEEKEDDFKFDFEKQFGTGTAVTEEIAGKAEEPAPFKQTAPPAEVKDETSEADFEFDFEKFEAETGKTDSAVKEEKKAVADVSLESFIKEDSSQKDVPPVVVDFEINQQQAAPVGKNKVEEPPKESMEKEESFDFEFEFSNQEDDKNKQEPEGGQIPEFQEFNFEEPGVSQSIDEAPAVEPKGGSRELEPSVAKKSVAPAQNELSFAFESPEEMDLSAKEEKEKPASTPDLQVFMADEPKPASGWLVYVVSVLLVVIIAGGGIAALWWQKAKMLEKEGGIGISGVKMEYYESKTLDRVLVVTGKTTNGYKVPKSFLRIKCVIYGKDNVKLAEKIVYAGNAFTPAEIKELTYVEIEKGLGNKMGKSMMNVDVPPGKSLPFMIVFDKQPDEALNIEVESL